MSTTLSQYPDTMMKIYNARTFLEIQLSMNHSPEVKATASHQLVLINDMIDLFERNMTDEEKAKQKQLLDMMREFEKRFKESIHWKMTLGTLSIPNLVLDKEEEKDGAKSA